MSTPNEMQKYILKYENVATFDRLHYIIYKHFYLYLLKKIIHIITISVKLYKYIIINTVKGLNSITTRHANKFPDSHIYSDSSACSDSKRGTIVLKSLLMLLAKSLPYTMAIYFNFF